MSITKHTTTKERLLIMCLNKRRYKILTTITVILLTVSLAFSLVSCNILNNFETYRIPYRDDYSVASMHPRYAIIKSNRELDDYFTQEDYILKGENYDETVAQFDEEFFEKYALIAALDDIDAKVKIARSKSLIKIIYTYSSDMMRCVVPNLYFIRVPLSFVGERTSIIRESRHNY